MPPDAAGEPDSEDAFLRIQVAALVPVPVQATSGAHAVYAAWQGASLLSAVQAPEVWERVSVTREEYTEHGPEALSAKVAKHLRLQQPTRITQARG